MTIKSANYQDTFDIVIGSGSLSYEWWHRAEVWNEDTDIWAVRLTADSGNEGESTVVINHALVMKTARAIIESTPKYASSALLRECRNLVFNSDEVDFDACSADELLQVMVLGEIVFG